MNIFVLSKNPYKAAIAHKDRHFVLIKEAAQMMSAVVYLHGRPNSYTYRITHPNHPCTLWVGASIENWNWLKELAYHLNEEYRYRYDRKNNYKSYDVIKKLRTPRLPDIDLTPFALAMPDIYKSKNAVRAYRNYYRGEKLSKATWKRRGPPVWLTAYL